MENKIKQRLLHLTLFLVTLVTTTIAGAEWRTGKFFIGIFYDGIPHLSWGDLMNGLSFSIPFLLIFTFHEFGHYFMARYYKVKVTLPFFIPLPPIPSLIGTLGAVIRIKEHIKSKTMHFDIGIAGPLAGFVVAVIVLLYGYTHLPEKEYVYEIHPEYQYFGENYDQYVYGYDTIVTKEQVQEKLRDLDLELYADTVFRPVEGVYLRLSKTLLISAFEQFIVPDEDKDKIPNPYEYAHYPFLFAGYLALFFTALNLLPIGQLDGGHVVYGLFGRQAHTIIATTSYIMLLFYAGLGLINPFMPVNEIMLFGGLYTYFLYMVLKSTGWSNQNRLMAALILFATQFLLTWLYPGLEGFSGWLLFAFMIGRFIGIQHPPSDIEQKLDTNRVILGWLALIILVLCISPAPMIID